MSKSNEPPRTISPELRRRLQDRYARAQSLLARASYDFAAVHRLLAENLASDPGNLRYIELLLLNLKRRGEAGARPGVWQRWISGTPLGAHAAAERAIAAAEWHTAARLACDALWSGGLQADHLALVAEACRGLGLGPAELLYRKAAVEVAPTKAEPVRQLAQALGRWGHYDDARDWWRQLLPLQPDDAEALAAIATRQPAAMSAEEAALRETVAANPADVEALLKLAEIRLSAADFDKAGQWLRQASAVGGGDLRVRDAWESLSLAQSEHRLRMAREAAEREPTDESQRLAAALADEHERLALAITHSQAERFPADGGLKLQLARQLKQSGNYSGAVQRLEELRRLAGFERVALVELGECWQRLRQFGKAIDYYREAIELPASDAADAADEQVMQLALYRGAVLAEALGEPAQACGWLERLIAAAGGYKDAQERLDKLRSICDKNGFSAG